MMMKWGFLEYQISLKNNKKKVKFQSKAIFLKDEMEILKIVIFQTNISCKNLEY